VEDIEMAGDVSKVQGNLSPGVCKVKFSRYGRVLRKRED
jgi:hypothetical protein